MRSFKTIVALAFCLSALMCAGESEGQAETVVEFTGEAIQRAIDTLAAKGGGKVVVPPGLYPIITIRLRSEVELHLKKGAVLSGSNGFRKYARFPMDRSITMVNMGRGLIQAWNETNVSITGEGVVDAGGEAYFDMSSPNYKGAFFRPRFGERPVTVQFCRCANIRISGVSFLNAAGWGMHIRLCKNVDIEGIEVRSDRRFINSDGIDLDASCHVRMRSSKICTGDDSLSLRAIREPDSSEHAILEDIVVEDCDFVSGCQTIRVGCPSDDTVRNVMFRNIRAAGRNGIFFDYPVRYLTKNDTGYVDVHDIVFDGYTGEFYGSALQIVVEPGIKLRAVRDVLFKDINVKSAKPLRFVDNAHTRLVRLKRINFTLNGMQMSDGEFYAD